MNVKRITLALCALLLAAPALAEQVKWQGKTIDGKDVAVPGKKLTVVAFLRPGQKQSTTAQHHLAKVTQGADDLDIIAVVSGPDAAMRAAQQDGDPIPWPLVADPLFEASGSMNVHVWPTTLIISPAGEVVAHVPSLTSAYVKDMEAHLAFARGSITPAERDKRLASTEVITDSGSQIAARHVRIAQQMTDRRRVDLAKAELETVLKMNPTDARINLDVADLQSRLGQPQEAIARLDTVPTTTAPPWHAALIRGRSLVHLRKYDEAAEALKPAVSLNPKPAEGWYLLGVVHEKQGHAAEATTAYRKAYETTDEGRSRVVE